MLPEAALTQPQLAYAVRFPGLCRMNELFCYAVPQCGKLFQELKMSLFFCFLPAMLGIEVSAVERCLFALPL